MTGGIAQALAPPNPAPGYAVRVGVVQASPAATATDVTVTIDDQTHRFPFQAPYVPVAGDQVNVLLLGGSGSTMSGIVIGGRSGTSGNLVLNGMFEHAPQFPQPVATNLPYHWSLYTASGTAATVASHFDSNQLRPLLLVQHVSGSAGDNYVFSAAFPVTPGETLYGDSIADYSTFTGGLGETTLTVELSLAWFASADAVYPDALSVTVLDSATDTFFEPGVWLGGTTTVPTGASWARTMHRTSQTGGNLEYHAEVGAISTRRQL